MDVITAVRTRRSHHQLAAPAPDNQEFAYLLSAAADSPDHGRLRPWRWILVRDSARTALGACFAVDNTDPGRRDKAAEKVLRAPLLATLVFTPRLDVKIPEWEQLAATSAMAQSLMLLLHAKGFGSMWRTGSAVGSGEARHLFGLAETERLLGWLYVGTPTGVPMPRRQIDVTDKLFQLLDGRVSRYRPPMPDRGRDAPVGTGVPADNRQDGQM